MTTPIVEMKAQALHRISPACIHHNAPDHAAHTITVGEARAIHEQVTALLTDKEEMETLLLEVNGLVFMIHAHEEVSHAAEIMDLIGLHQNKKGTVMSGEDLRYIENFTPLTLREDDDCMTIVAASGRPLASDCWTLWAVEAVECLNSHDAQVSALQAEVKELRQSHNGLVDERVLLRRVTDAAMDFFQSGMRQKYPEPKFADELRESLTKLAKRDSPLSRARTIQDGGSDAE